MPFIEESDLLELHKDIDKAQIINERLLDQIKYKNKELKRKKLQRNLFAGITALFLIASLAITSFTAGVFTNKQNLESTSLNVPVDSMQVVLDRIDNLKKQNRELSLVNEFYLARNFLEKETIYSVQIKSFVENNLTLSSQSLNNTLFVKTNPFYSYSLGNFETLEEAQKFRKQLVNMGFDDAFVASYKEGKRLKIEPAN